MSQRRVPKRISGVVRAGLALLALALALGSGSTSAVAADVDAAIANGSAQRQLDTALARWRAAHIVDYHFTLHKTCLCPPPNDQTIVVRNGTALHTPEPLAATATVPRLHQVIQQAIADRVAHLTVRYDPRGVPLEVLIDPVEGWVDDEIGYVVSDFVVDRRSPVATSGLGATGPARGATPQGW